MYTLVIWAVLAAAPYGNYPNWHTVAANFTSKQLCENAASELGVVRAKFRCLQTS